MALTTDRISVLRDLPGRDIPKIQEGIKTDHFGLVSDFLSECWSRLRGQGRASVLQGRFSYGGSLSGRDQNAVNKTISGLLKLIHPSPEEEVPDEDLEWAMRLAMEVRRRVKEQQKRIVPAEFRNTQFSYTLGQDGIEKFVVTPELQSEDSIGRDPLPPGQVWEISPGGGEGEGSGLFRIEVTEGPGGGVRILNRPSPPAFAESVKYAQQNLYARARSWSETATPVSTSSRSSSVPSTLQKAVVPSAWPLSWRCVAHFSARACGAAW